MKMQLAFMALFLWAAHMMLLFFFHREIIYHIENRNTKIYDKLYGMEKNLEEINNELKILND